MSLDDAAVAKIARLARIRVSPEETASLVGELNNIFSWIEQLNAVNTERVEPMTSVVPQTLGTRSDTVDLTVTREQILANAPEKAAGFFVVPKVVE